MSDDKQWATEYLLDPLNAPAPSEETGPGSHHAIDGRNPFRRAAKSDISSAPEPVLAALKGPKQATVMSTTERPSSRKASIDRVSMPSEATPRERRKSSLSQQHGGDRPLDMLRANEKAAQRAPNRRKKHHVGADSVDSLDLGPGGAYHHEGPYDATLLAKNLSRRSAPLEAVRSTNLETLRATPREKVLDSIQRHMPLDGVALLPSGMPDPHGRVLRYQEGDDMMTQGLPESGAYKRWPGIQYHPQDFKGKGEPAYSIERALKDHRRNKSESHANDFEMRDQRRRPSNAMGPPSSIPRRDERQPARNRGSSLQASAASGIDTDRYATGERYVDWQSRGPASRQGDAGIADSLRKRVGSLKV